MKKLKKLLSVVLACAMALSLCATALASEEDEPTPVTSFEDTNGAPVDVGDSIDAQSITQGGLPAKPISIILPTVTAREDLDEGQLQVFDFFLDPHQLITKTEAARYEDSTFAPDTRLYFAADEEKSEYTYDSSSQSLTVTNTGFVDLDVDLDLEFDRGGAEFDLVSSPTSFAANAAEEVPAQMYLAIVGGGQTKPVLDPTTIPKVVDVTTTGKNFITTAGVKFEYPTFNAASVYGLTSSDTTQLAAAKEFYDEKIEALETALKGTNAAITLTYTEAVTTPTAADAYITVALAGVSTPFVTTINSVSGSTLTPVTNGRFTTAGSVAIVITAVDNRGTADVTTDDKTVTLAKISFALATFPTSGVATNDAQTFKFDVPHTGAKIETALGVLEDSYKLSHTTDSDKIDELEAKNVVVTDNGYYWEQIEEDTTLYPAFSFHLVGDINEALNTDDDSSPWDDVANDATSGATAIGFTMIWDITPYDKTQARTKLTTPAGAEDESNDVLPTVTVTKAATGTGSTTKTATLTWTAGSGAYASYTPTAAKSGNASATSIALNSTGSNTFTLVATTTNKNSKCFVTFSDGTNSVDVEVNGWYTGT